MNTPPPAAPNWIFGLVAADDVTTISLVTELSRSILFGIISTSFSSEARFAL
jgi:hypothetical protein